MRCKKCGQQIANDALFCDFCGAKVDTESEKIFCGNCGAEIEAGSDFCGNCGALADGGTIDSSTIYITPEDNDRVRKRKSRKTGIIVLTVSLVVLAVFLSGIIGYIFMSGRTNDQISVSMNSNNTNVDNPTLSPAHSMENSREPNASAAPNGQMAVSTTTPLPTMVPVTLVPTAYAESKHTYQVVVSKVTWDVANQSARSMGGYLVAINNSEEFQELTALLSKSEYANVKNVWIGACAPAGISNAAEAAAYWNSVQAAWVNGDPFIFTKWRNGEPSGYDAKLNAAERYLQMFRPKADNYQWSYNDAGDDLSEYKDGSLAYVVEFER